jgi:hypothetical protein
MLVDYVRVYQAAPATAVTEESTEILSAIPFHHPKK